MKTETLKSFGNVSTTEGHLSRSLVSPASTNVRANKGRTNSRTRRPLPVYTPHSAGEAARWHGSAGCNLIQDPGSRTNDGLSLMPPTPPGPGAAWTQPDGWLFMSSQPGRKTAPQNERREAWAKRWKWLSRITVCFPAFPTTEVFVPCKGSMEVWRGQNSFQLQSAPSCSGVL